MRAIVKAKVDLEKKGSFKYHRSFGVMALLFFMSQLYFHEVGIYFLWIQSWLKSCKDIFPPARLFGPALLFGTLEY